VTSDEVLFQEHHLKDEMPLQQSLPEERTTLATQDVDEHEEKEEFTPRE